MSLNYSYKDDISYAIYNNKNIPWKLNTSYIRQNNEMTNTPLNIGIIKNNLLIESSQNNILLNTSLNKKVIVKNNMIINNLDVSNILDTNYLNVNNISLSRILNIHSDGSFNIIGNVILDGGLSVGGNATDVSASESVFRNVAFSISTLYDVCVNECKIYLSDFSYNNIYNSNIYNTPIGYTNSGNTAPNNAIFSDVSLISLILDNSINSKRYIKFSNNSNTNSSIIIKSSDDYSKLAINKPLNIGNRFGEDVSIFNGDISCNTLYYSNLVPDVKLNNYFDVSIGLVSVSGNIIPSSNINYDIGSSNYSFNNIYSKRFIGDLSGSCSIANDLVKNLDMSFNNLDIYGAITLNGNNINQVLSRDFISISNSVIFFNRANNNLRDLSLTLYSKTEFDLCLNTNIAKISLLESSFIVLRNNITSISNSVYSKSDFDLCLNRNILRISDVSAIASLVSSAPNIYSNLGYNDSSLIKQTNSKASNELVFPYAITYIDDAIEDTNLKEAYSYKKTTNKTTTTVTSAYTITYTRVWSSTYSDATLQRQPDDVNHKYLILENIGNGNTDLRRKWYDVLGTDPQPAVYRKIVAATNRTYINTTFELNTDLLSWDDHKRQAARTDTTSSLISERSLAVITTDTENTNIKGQLTSTFDRAWIGAERIKSRTWNVGGTVTEDFDYIYHTFTTVGTTTFTPNATITVDYLIVAGGGSGGAGRGGGGGAGGVRTGTSQLNAGTAYNITVGAGGARAFNNLSGNKGGNSSIGTAVAEGGGGGGGWNDANGGNGGSGGGAGVGIYGSGIGGLGNAIQGNYGSNTYDGSTGGGGGGAGGAAQQSKNGGIGITSSITGTPKYYAGGGGGGNANEGGEPGVAYGGTYRGSNGTYGGGNGSRFNSSTAYTYTWKYNAWTDDASTGLDSNATYTVAVNLGDTNAATVNGVYFQANAMSGTNFSIGGGVNYFSGLGVVHYSTGWGTGPVTGTGVALTPNFLYGGEPRTLTLTKLTPGATYKTSFFSIGWGNSTDRNQTFSANIHAVELNPNIYGTSNDGNANGFFRGIIFNLTFIADNTGTAEFTITPVNTGSTLHLHAIANRLVSITSPPSEPYTDAVANTGGGGGGTDPGFGLPSGAGGSGIVIIRYPRNRYLEGGNTFWKWHNNEQWSFTNWDTYEPGPSESYGVILTNGVWHDYGNSLFPAIYMKKNYTPARSASTTYELDTTLLTWEGHKTRALQRSGNGITYTLASIIDNNENEAVANTAGSYAKVYIGGKRKTSSSATGRTSSDWEWTNGTSWSYTNFYNGYIERTYTSTFTGGTTPVGSSTTTNRPQDANTNTSPIPAVFFTSTDIPETNVKMPLLVSSNNGSIIATATAIKVLDLPPTPSNTTSGNRNVNGFTDIDGGSNTQTLQEFYNYASNSNTNTTDYKIQKRTLKYEYDTFSYEYSHNTNNGLTTGSFKISDNSNNESYYTTSSTSAIPTSYSCIAITNDGMFVALGKANDVTIFMRDINGWVTLGSQINSNINFLAYTDTSVGIIPTLFTENWRKNLQNLAINYISGSSSPTIFLAFGNARSSVVLYSYSGVLALMSTGLYNITTPGNWSLKQTYIPDTTRNENSATNFGYFVSISSSPNVLGFTVDDKFYTYNCITYARMGSRKTLDYSYNATTKNIIAFKMSSDADKIIVSSTYYVFIYKWNLSLNDWDLLTYISLISSNNTPSVTFTYGGSTIPIPAGPRSLDIRNISNNECVFAIGFPDKLINSRANNRARGYVEYWNYSNNKLTKLVTLVPRKRIITNRDPDNDEYFFSAGGIKITNVNTILVAPNFKFHLNNTIKQYELDISNISWAQHYIKSVAVTNRFFASIQNEVENELVKVASRNTSVWIGGRRRDSSITTRGKTFIDWEWIAPNNTWFYQSFASGQPDNISHYGVEFDALGQWKDTDLATQRNAIYMTSFPQFQYSLNTFSIFDKFFFHSSGFSSSYFPTNISNTVIAKWRTNDISSIYIQADGALWSKSKGSISDIRLKENIVDTSPKLQKLLKVRVVNYNLKGNVDKTKYIGVVAQELEELFPGLVNEGELSIQDINLGRTESYKSVKYSCFDIILIKALQEQLAIVNRLNLQLDELESACILFKTYKDECVMLNKEMDLLKSENELVKLNINEILKLMYKDIIS